MKLCFPVTENRGLESRVFGHFGSAPGFVVFDTEAGVIEEIFNRDQHHHHGACRPLKALGGAPMDAVVVGGIGAGALSGLKSAGIVVFRASGGTVQHNIEAWKRDELNEITIEEVCVGHGQGHGCGA